MASQRSDMLFKGQMKLNTDSILDRSSTQEQNALHSKSFLSSANQKLY